MLQTPEESSSAAEKPSAEQFVRFGKMGKMKRRNEQSTI